MDVPASLAPFGDPTGRADGADLGRRWWLYLAAFLVFTAGIPAPERALLARTTASGSFILAIAAAAVAARYVSLRLPPRVGAEPDPDSPIVAPT